MNKSRNLFIHFILLIVVTLEGLVSYKLITVAVFYKVIYLVCHIVLGFFFSRLLKKIECEGIPQDSNVVFISLILSWSIPFYGMLGMLILSISMEILKIQPVEYFDFDIDVISKHTHPFPSHVDRNIVSIKSEELEIEAFQDIFMGPDRQLQENAINKLSKIINRDSVTLLKDVIKKSRSDIKMLAASAMIDMEDEIIKKIERFKHSLSENPENEMDLLELARSYDLYCYLGLLDAVVLSYYSNLGLEQYQRFLERRPDHIEAKMEYGRLLLHSGNSEKAVSVLSSACEGSPEDPKPRLWLAEAYYELLEYEKVSEVCQQLSHLKPIPSKFKEIVNWWAPEKPDSQQEYADEIAFDSSGELENESIDWAKQ
ncbi:MAG: tetratricopeptide repeat protein [bacterium]